MRPELNQIFVMRMSNENKKIDETTILLDYTIDFKIILFSDGF